jgi:hypothetical protein
MPQRLTPLFLSRFFGVLALRRPQNDSRSLQFGVTCTPKSWFSRSLAAAVLAKAQVLSGAGAKVRDLSSFQQKGQPQGVKNREKQNSNLRVGGARTVARRARIEIHGETPRDTKSPVPALSRT